jgi:hypothetical protein
MIDFLDPIQRRYRLIAADPASLAEMLQKGARKARERSEATLERVYRAVGFVPGGRDHQPPTGGWMPRNEGTLYSPVPAAPGAWHHRRNTMETKDIKDVVAAGRRVGCGCRMRRIVAAAAARRKRNAA